MFELKIKVKRINQYNPLPEVIAKGDWVDLYCASTTRFDAPRVIPRTRNISFDCKRIPLGVAMKLPKGIEAVVASRSSTPDTYGIEMRNCLAIIDNTFCGNNDEWRFSARAMRETTIYGPRSEEGGVAYGSRICQFRIQLSQKATFWQKLRWLISGGIRIVEVDNLDDKSRGGFGTTGK